MLFSLSAFGLCLTLSCLPLHIHIQNLIMCVHAHVCVCVCMHVCVCVCVCGAWGCTHLLHPCTISVECLVESISTFLLSFQDSASSLPHLKD